MNSNGLHIIAIAGKSGTGKGSTVKALKAKLAEKYPQYRIGSGSVGNMMREYGTINQMSLEEVDARKDNEPSIDYWLDTRVHAQCFEIGAEGIAVVEARLAAQIVPVSAFRVLLQLPDDIRFQRIADRDNVTFQVAKEATLRREQSMDVRFKRNYSIGMEQAMNPKFFHINLPTRDFSPEQLAETIIAGAELLWTRQWTGHPEHEPLWIFK